MDKETRKYAIQMAFASSIGIAMIIAIFGCLLLGVYLDKKLIPAMFLLLFFCLLV